MIPALAALWALNLFDALATWYAVNVMHYARELNPIMDEFLRRGPFVFFGFKIGVGSFLVWVMSKAMATAPARFARLCVYSLVTLYSLLAVWHCILFFA